MVADSVGELVEAVMALRAAKAHWNRDVNDIERRRAYHRALVRVLTPEVMYTFKRRPTRDDAGEPRDEHDRPCPCGQYWESQCICN